MGRLKMTPAAMGEPDYIRIEQVMYKFGCSENRAREIGLNCGAQRYVDGYTSYNYEILKKYFDTCPLQDPALAN